MVPGMYEPPSRYNIIVTVARDDGGRLPDPVTFAVAADEAAWRRSASMVSTHTADQIIGIVTVYAPDQYAAVAIARAVALDALRHQGASGDLPADDARVQAEVQRASAA